MVNIRVRPTNAVCVSHGTSCLTCRCLIFLTYMSGREPDLVRNEAGCTCTNSVHSVRLRNCDAVSRLMSSWESPFLKLSCEKEGHALGGGMLKLEPGEANQLVFPPLDMLSRLNATIIDEAITTMRAWRHYAHES
jgi:adenine-specific DNA-methyltransferase